MDAEVARLLQVAVTDLVRLEVTLLFHQNPGFVETGEAIARRLYRDPALVGKALEGLVGCGLLDRFELGRGRYVLYGYTQDVATRGSVAVLSVAYHESDRQRVEIIRCLMKFGLMGPKQGAKA